ncbi:MAG TPA: hypothetical protein VFY93_00990 [Planctomycetota bacterium]|nr:hypothetical protein [Planctomycetota bacterium]
MRHGSPQPGVEGVHWRTGLNSYMGRQANTTNRSTELPLAQGIRFDL